MGFFANEAAKRDTAVEEKMQVFARPFLCVWVA